MKNVLKNIISTSATVAAGYIVLRCVNKDAADATVDMVKSNLDKASDFITGLFEKTTEAAVETAEEIKNNIA